MFKKGMLLFILLVSTASMLIAGSESQNFGIKFSGFVKTDLMFDSRQTVAAREGHFLLYPATEFLDEEGEDINAVPNLNILAIQTRLKGSITGPDAFGAKTSGVIEGAFFGHSDSDVNGFRLRHAFLTLTWDANSILIGQTWHPLFVPECFPGVVSFNTGVPFQPFSRNPQVRLTHSMGAGKIFVAAMAQRDFTSTGPEGGSSKYLRNAAIPNLHAQAQFKASKHVFGVGGDWKALRPRLVTANNYKSTELVTSIAALGYARLDMPGFTLKMEGVYGQNMTDMLMLGGYGVESVDATTAVETYIPTSLFSVWGEFITGTNMELACFVGMTQNLGCSDPVSNSWGRSLNIDNVFRVSPRVVWKSGKTHFATELEYTSAAYGTPDSKGKVENTTSVTNIRLLLAAYYFF